MNDSNDSANFLYTNTNKFIMVIDSRNADDFNNGTSNSDMTFRFQEPIMIPKGAIKMTCCVLAFTAPHSIYNINQYNNYIHMYFGSPNIEVKVYIPYGDYNSSTFMTQFVASVLSANSTLGTGLSITLNAVTNRFTVSHTSTSILFVFDSTISPVIGMNSSLGEYFRNSWQNHI